MRYMVLVDGKAGAYGVVFPDIPGCNAMGKTIDQALAHAADALRDFAELGEALRSPRPSEELRQDPAVIADINEGAVLASVPLVRATGRSVKANLSIDEGILAPSTTRPPAASSPARPWSSSWHAKRCRL